MTYKTADLFCGAGGSSTGMVLAANRLGVKLDLVAVNHWQTAVDTHTRNHPWARHVCADLGSVEADPSKLVPGGKLDLLIASPECTHFSNARGDKPCDDQSRASVYHVLHWLERLDVHDVLIENVMEFAKWGPTLRRGLHYKNRYYRRGRPDPRRKGILFNAMIETLRAMDYTVEWRVMNAADFGEATARRRLFIRASRKAIRWPDPTHAGHWRAAREVIDWDLKGENIATRKRPLQPRTLQRIEAGLRKFGGEAFLVVLKGMSSVSSIDVPMPTNTAHAAHLGLCDPFVMNVAHRGADGSRCRSVDAPLSTIPSGHRGELALCEPFLVEYHSEKGTGKARVASVDSPLPTQSTENRFGLCEPFIVPMDHSGRNALRSVDEPLPTITSAKGGAFGMCVPFLAKYYGTAQTASIDEPLDTITAKDRFALVEPYSRGIRFRMLQPHELAAAMGFDAYQFAGNKTEQVRQIGNAVCVHMAEALCRSIFVARAP